MATSASKGIVKTIAKPPRTSQDDRVTWTCFSFRSVGLLVAVVAVVEKKHSSFWLLLYVDVFIAGVIAYKFFLGPVEPTRLRGRSNRRV